MTYPDKIYIGKLSDGTLGLCNDEYAVEYVRVQPDHIPDGGEMVQQPVSAALMPECTTPDMYAHSPTLQAAYKWGFAQALAQAGGQWLPIESAPKNEKTIFLIYEHCNPNIGWQGCEGYYNPSSMTWSLESGYTEHPTHWMQLPAAPVSAKEQP
jgi:hypothetical protein